jgi:hypothetical protein
MGTLCGGEFFLQWGGWKDNHHDSPLFVPSPSSDADPLTRIMTTNRNSTSLHGTEANAIKTTPKTNNRCCLWGTLMSCRHAMTAREGGTGRTVVIIPEPWIKRHQGAYALHNFLRSLEARYNELRGDAHPA